MGGSIRHVGSEIVSTGVCYIDQLGGYESLLSDGKKPINVTPVIVGGRTVPPARCPGCSGERSSGTEERY